MNRIDLVTRRTFLGGVFTAGAFVLSARLFPLEAFASSAGTGSADKAAWNPSVYLGIESDGTVIVVAHRSEMGTGIRTGLPVIVADSGSADDSLVVALKVMTNVRTLSCGNVGFGAAANRAMGTRNGEHET